MTWIKICGITNIEDALTAVEAGADALGFVFYEKSPRMVDPETVREIVKTLPMQVEKVGVFVNESPDLTENVAERLGLTAIQLHVEVSPLGENKLHGMKASERLKHYVALPVRHFLDEGGRFHSFALSVRNSVRNDEANEWVSAFFLDSGTPGQVGGTGRTFDWHRAVQVAEVIKQAGFNLAVAGGLTPANVTEAIHVLQPWGVDVSSGVELKPGKKDPDKVRAFVAAVRQAERVA